MSRTSVGNKPKRPLPPHQAVVRHLRDMRAALAKTIPTWDVKATIDEVVQEIPRVSEPLPLGLQIVGPDGQPLSGPGEPHHWIEKIWARRRRRPAEFPQAESANWDALWKLAVHMRDQADRLATYAAQQGKLARQQAHPTYRRLEDE